MPCSTVSNNTEHTKLNCFVCRLPSITKIKPKRNKASNSPNPYKALQMRQDIKSEYTETQSDIADRELKRLNKTKGTYF